MTLKAVLYEMPHDLFRLCLRNAMVAEYEQTEEGRKYLQDAVRLRQTEPDYVKIRAQKGYAAEVIVTKADA